LIDWLLQAKHQEMLKYNNALAALQTRLDEAENEALRSESRWMHVHNTSAARTLLIGRIKMSVPHISVLSFVSRQENSERKCADTTGTVPVPWAGWPFPMLNTHLDFTEARDSEWQWHHLVHMQVCTLLQTDNHVRQHPTPQFFL